MDALKKLAVASIVVWAYSYEFRYDCVTWLPAWGDAGAIGGQFDVLGVIGGLLLLTIIWFVYRSLSHLLD